MNKLIILALACCAVAVVSASPTPTTNENADTEMSQFSLTDPFSLEDETASLEGKSLIFAEFCTESRDLVLGRINNATNGLASSVFGTIISAIDLVKLGAVQREAGAEHQQLIGQDIKQIKGAPAAVASALLLNAREQAITAYQEIMHKFKGESFKVIVRNVCGEINDLAGKVKGMYDGYVAKTLNAEGGEAFREILKVPPSQTGCLTTGRLARVIKTCKVLETALPTFSLLYGDLFDSGY